MVTGCNYRSVFRLRECIAQCRWHLTLSSSFVTYYVYQSNILLSVTYHSKPFYNHFSLCTEMVQKLYQNGPPSCTEVVQAELACSLCTEIGLYRSHPPPCPEVVMYRIWSYPRSRIGFVQFIWDVWTIRTSDYSHYGWTIHTLDDSYDGLFVPWTIRTMDCSYHSRI